MYFDEASRSLLLGTATGKETAREIASVAKSYRVFYRRVESEEASEYLMDHSGFVYLMGPDGSFLTMFRGGTNPESIGKTIITYVQKGKARARS